MANCQNNMHRGRRPIPQRPLSPQTYGITQDTHSAKLNRCTCSENDPLSQMPPAMAYVPWQKWQNIYDIHKGFHSGTVFQDLDKPFLWKGGRCR